jgi:hypothetical protein
VLLMDADQHPRERRRFELTGELVRRAGPAAVVAVEAQGETRTARLLDLVMLGDLVSLELARGAGVDPSPVPMIETMKQELGPP